MQQFRGLLLLALFSGVALINATNVASQVMPAAPSPPVLQPQPNSPVISPAPPAPSAPPPAARNKSINTTITSSPPTVAGAAETKIVNDKPADSAVTPMSSVQREVKQVEPSKAVALILPFNSKTLGMAAEAVRAGFVAAYEISGKDKFSYRSYLADDDGPSLAALYRKAVQEGAVAVVAGLTRDGAAVAAKEAGYLPTLALNLPADLSKADANNFFHISLSLDGDARQIARIAFKDNFRNIVVLGGPTSLSNRIQDAFEKEWLRLGGTIAARIAFSGEQVDGPKVKQAMEKEDASKADAVFIAPNMSAARVARPYLPTGMPVFATAHSVEPRAETVENLDLDSVKYLEMPWFAERDHAAVMSYPRSPDGTPVDYERLYALGIDAWRIISAMLQPAIQPVAGNVNIVTDRPMRTFVPIDGVTGRISLDGNQFVRSLSLLEMRDGKPNLIKSAE